MKWFEMAAGRMSGVAVRSGEAGAKGAIDAIGAIGVAGWIGVLGAAWPLNAAAQAAGTEGANFIYLGSPGRHAHRRGRPFHGATRPLARVAGTEQGGGPYRLPPGMRLRIPLVHIPVATLRTARVVFVTGPASADGRALQAGMELAEGARIETGAGGTVTMELGDGSRVTPPPASRMEVSRLRAFARRARTDAVFGVGQGRRWNPAQRRAARASGALKSAPLLW
ncbi:hypothetical protein ACU4GD_34625 [Cupriavidus basilensis]